MKSVNTKKPNEVITENIIGHTVGVFLVLDWDYMYTVAHAQGYHLYLKTLPAFASVESQYNTKNKDMACCNILF